jgi:DNA-binding response OmpR family regulator
VSERALIADGDSARGRAIGEACSARGIACTRAVHGAGALESALGELPDILVAQLDLPLIDGPTLAAILRVNPRTQGIDLLFVGDRPSDAHRTDLRGEVIPPPVDPDQVARRVQLMLEKRSRDRSDAGEPEEPGGVEGQLSQLPLAELLQLFHVSRKTGVVEVTRSDARGLRAMGRVLLSGGDVIHAESAPVKGAKALYRMLGWDRGSFAFRPEPVTAPPQIQTPTRALLREGLRQLAESERMAFDLPPSEAQVTLKIQRAALPNVIHPLTQEVLVVLEHYSRVGDVVDHCTYPDYQVLRTLHTLISRGMVELQRETPPFEEEAAGLFSPAQVARLREWLDARRARGGTPRDAKLLVVASDAAATRDFARLLQGIPGVDLNAQLAMGALSAADLAPLGRVAVDGEIGIEIVHVPASERFAPIWPVAAHGALGTLLLLSTPVAEAGERIRRAEEEMRKAPRARAFHVVLLEKRERDAQAALREKLSLLDDGSLFLIPLENQRQAGVLLRELLARVLP